MRDEEILDLFFARDDRAITMTAQKYGASLTHMSWNFVGHEDAEECVNDTYLSAWNHIPPARPENYFAWLAKVLRNFLISRVRRETADKRSGELVEFSEELAQCIPDPRVDRQRESEELGSCISAFLRTLPQEKRVMFLRRYWFGDSIQDVAERYGYTESKVKVTLHRVRGQLKKYLEQEGVAV